METFSKLKSLVHNTEFQEQREQSIKRLDLRRIDTPLVELIKSFSELPFCFTLQCCYGHFLHSGKRDRIIVFPITDSSPALKIEYKIAYIALCLQNSNFGKAFLEHLVELIHIDPAYIQVGCAEWFWNRQINSYIIQVEPKRLKNKDTAIVDIIEAQHIDKIRKRFFTAIQQIVTLQQS